MDLLAVVAVLFILAGMVASVLPLAPAGLVALTGVGFYWIATGFSKPGPLVLVVLVVLGVAAVVAETLSAGVFSKGGGASTRAALVGMGAGLVLFFFVGPLGVVIGVAAAVFAAEFHETRDAEGSVSAGVAAGVGVVAAAAIELALTGLMFLVFVLFAV
ncbi:DUF456 family protein [Halocalculus aciditolerans]|uniref:DUF456 domain-containing protein n=1 Tax=Halocalculus aciditolerans TaxID=1383812 RepID=A0A830FH62_9EURY|nr:DUF456 family protein [Halocalculus aciditolerans]GGL54899.1 hypothetical protein GCM10009039_11250 [Halocalculus aciditolerans]